MFFVTPQWYTTDAFFNKMFQFKHILLQLFNKHWIYFFFFIFWHAPTPPSIGMPCYRSSLNSFLSSSRFSNLIYQTKRIIFIKFIIKINIIKVYVKNAHFITIKYNITRILIKVKYISICIQYISLCISMRKIVFNHSAFNKPIGNKFQCCYRISSSIITRFMSCIYLYIFEIYHQSVKLKK